MAGSVAAAIRWRAKDGLTALLLWLPLPFYAYSVAYGSVPIFIPLWWPHSWYNTRYGMEMLPIFALSLAFLVALCSGLDCAVQASRGSMDSGVVALLIVANNAVLLRAKPLVLDEAIANSRTRIPFEVAYAHALQSLPRTARFSLIPPNMSGRFSGPGSRSREPSTRSDYYEWAPALEDPAKAADYVIATDGDRVAQAVAAKPDGLTLINIVCSTGQPCARFYRSDRHVGEW